MAIIKAGYQFIEEPSVTKKIERVARVCYKSEDKIQEGSDLKMVNALIRREHTAMLEHASVALIVDRCTYNYLNQIRETMETCCTDDIIVPENCYLRFTYAATMDSGMTSHRYIVSGNVRAWYRFLVYANSYDCGIPLATFNVLNHAVNRIFDRFNKNVGISKGYQHFFDDSLNASASLITDFSKLSTKERLIHEDVSVLFTVDRGVTHELVRHRDASFAQESTRYCNYSLDKFCQEVNVIEPCFYEGRDDEYNAWVSAVEDAQMHYFDLLAAGSKPQEARDVLSTSTKADIVVTTNLREWMHILNLRACDSTGPAHPQIKEVMIPVLKEMQKKYPFAFGKLIAAE